MTPEELAGKWYAKTHKISCVRDRMRGLEAELKEEQEAQRTLSDNLVESFTATDGHSPKTHRIFLPADDTFPATIVEVLSNSPASGVCSHPVGTVGKHVELEDPGT